LESGLFNGLRPIQIKNFFRRLYPSCYGSNGGRSHSHAFPYSPTHRFAAVGGENRRTEKAIAYILFFSNAGCEIFCERRVRGPLVTRAQRMGIAFRRQKSANAFALSQGWNAIDAQKDPI
jgi:hypothetical protein